MTWQVGSWMFDEPTRPSWHNASFLAIDVGAMVPLEDFESRLQKLVDEIHAAPTAEGIDRVLLPGEREWALHERAAKEGIQLPADVCEKLALASELTKVPLPWKNS